MNPPDFMDLPVKLGEAGARPAEALEMADTALKISRMTSPAKDRDLRNALRTGEP